MSHELFVSYLICICISRTARTPETDENCKETISIHAHIHIHTHSMQYKFPIFLCSFSSLYTRMSKSGCFLLFEVAQETHEEAPFKNTSLCSIAMETGFDFSITILSTSSEVRNITPALSNRVMPTSGEVRNITSTLSRFALYVT